MEHEGSIHAEGGLLPLVDAVRYNNIEDLDLLLSLGADINAPQPNGVNALVWAILGNQEMIIPLLERQADINANFPNRWSFLHLLAESDLVDVELFQEILTLHPEIAGMINYIDDFGKTPLMLAIQKSKVEIVLSLLNIDRDKIGINMKDKDGNTALMLAVLHCPEVIPLLLQAGSDIRIPGNKGLLPIFVAAGNQGSNDVLYSLLLAESAKEPLVLNMINPTGDTALIWAASAGTVGQMELLLAAGASISVERPGGWNVLSLLAYWNKEVAKIELILKHSDILTVLNKPNSDNLTPLMIAVVMKRMSNTQALLNTEGIDVGVVGQKGYTALHIAAMNESSDCLALLLAHKDIETCFEVRDQLDNQTPLQNAVEMKLVENVRLLLEKGANAQAEATMRLAIVSKNLDTMALLLSYGYDWKAFMQACRHIGKFDYIDSVKESQYFDEDKVLSVERTRPVKASRLNANVMAGYSGEEGENHQSQQRGFGL